MTNLQPFFPPIVLQSYIGQNNNWDEEEIIVYCPVPVNPVDIIRNLGNFSVITLNFVSSYGVLIKILNIFHY